MMFDCRLNVVVVVRACLCLVCRASFVRMWMMTVSVCLNVMVCILSCLSMNDPERMALRVAGKV